MSGRPVFAVEAGGTSTRVAVAGVLGLRREVAEVRRFGTVNPASAPAAAVAEHWDQALSWVRDFAGPGTTGWIASASVAQGEPGSAVSAVAAVDAVAVAVRAAGLTGLIAVSSDVTPLLLGPPLRGSGFVLVGGTGSTCLAGGPDGRAVRIGGHEYVLSDEGSGYQIGLRGLRAALRSAEGSGPTTLLADEHDDLPGYARYLASSPQAKAEIAAFATHVIDCGERGDQVAGQIVAEAAADLVSLIVAASRRLGCPVTNVLMCGSLVAAGTPVAGLAETCLRKRWPACEVRMVPDALAQCLALAGDLAEGRRPAGACGRPPLSVFELGAS